MHPTLGALPFYAPAIRLDSPADLVPVIVVGVAVVLLAAALIIATIRGRAAIDHHDEARRR